MCAARTGMMAAMSRFVLLRCTPPLSSSSRILGSTCRYLQTSMALSEQIKGIVQRVITHQPETGFTILSVSPETDKNNHNSRLSQQRSTLTVVGIAPQLYPGEEIVADGAWKQRDAKQGKRFSAWSMIQAANFPESLKDESLFLQSGAIKGIGKIYADQIISLAQSQDLTLLDVFTSKSELGKLAQKIKRFGTKRVGSVFSNWITVKEEREVFNYMVAHAGMGVPEALRTTKVLMETRSKFTVTEEVSIVDSIKDNPYKMVPFQFLSFRAAEEIAATLPPSEDLQWYRQCAGVLDCLMKYESQGHCGFPLKEVRRRAANLLNVPADSIDFERMSGEGIIEMDEINGKQCCFNPTLYHLEHSVASNLKDLAEDNGGYPTWGKLDNIADRIKKAELAKENFHLSASQRLALEEVLHSKLSIITGGPGVGKTCVLDVLLRVLQDVQITDPKTGKSRRVKVNLCAPTGRASSRLSASTGRRAETIHHLLHLQEGDTGFRANPLNCDLLIVDESSMVDLYLLSSLLLALPPEASLIFVGDPDQLPSIGPGDILRDLMASNLFTIVHLTEVHRQSADSQLIEAFHAINRGDLPPSLAKSTEEEGDFFFLKSEDSHNTMQLVNQLVTKTIPAKYGTDPVGDIQVLCPMKTKGYLSVEKLNRMLQTTLNPGGRRQDGVFGDANTCFRLKDKVMQVVNDSKKEVYNGEVGFVSFINVKKGSSEALQVTFPSENGKPRIVSYSQNDLSRDLVLAYATTIHKSQGCEFPVVIIALCADHLALLRRNLLYTAVTRAKKAVFVVGQESAFILAIKSDDLSDGNNELVDGRRWRSLSHRLLPAPAPEQQQPMPSKEVLENLAAVVSGNL